MYEQRNKTAYGQSETATNNDIVRPSIASTHQEITTSQQNTHNEENTHHSTGTLTATKNQSVSINKWAILVLAASSGFITTLDGSIVNIGLPAISQTFHVGISGQIEWIIIGYLVIIAAVLLTFGRLADMIGRKPIFLTGLVVFLLGSALCGMAPSLTLLIIARLFQGLGGAL